MRIDIDPEEYMPHLRRIVREHHVGSELRARLDETDVLHDAVLQVVARLDTFRGATVAEFVAWLQKVASRNFFNLLRYHLRARRHPSREVALRAEDGLAFSDTPSTIFSRNEVRTLLTRAVDSLPTRLREVVVLHKIRGCTLAKTAEILDVPPSTVAGRLRRALKQLRQRLQHVEF